MTSVNGFCGIDMLDFIPKVNIIQIGMICDMRAGLDWIINLYLGLVEFKKKKDKRNIKSY